MLIELLDDIIPLEVAGVGYGLSQVRKVKAKAKQNKYVSCHLFILLYAESGRTDIPDGGEYRIRMIATMRMLLKGLRECIHSPIPYISL